MDKKFTIISCRALLAVTLCLGIWGLFGCNGRAEAWSKIVDFETGSGDGGTVTSPGALWADPPQTYDGNASTDAAYTVNGSTLVFDGTVASASIGYSARTSSTAAVFGCNPTYESEGKISFSTGEIFTVTSLTINNIYNTTGTGVPTTFVLEASNGKTKTTSNIGPNSSETVNLSTSDFSNISWIKIKKSGGGSFSGFAEIDNISLTNVMKDTTAPVISTNNTLTMAAGTSEVIWNPLLYSTDSIFIADYVIYTVGTVPTPGALWLDSNHNTALDAGETLAAGSTFTQTDINSSMLRYTYNSGNTAASDSFTFTVKDPSGNTSSAATFNISIVPLNHAPTLTTITSNPSFAEGGAAVSIFSGTAVGIGSGDAGQSIKSVQLTVSNVTDGASEILTVDGTDVALTNGTSGTTTGGNSLGYAVSVSSSTATVTLSKIETAANWQTYINGIKYINAATGAGLTTGVRTVTLTSLKDSGGTANGGIDTMTLSIASAVTVSKINHAPTLTTTTSTPNFTEGGAAASLFSGTAVGIGAGDSGQNIKTLTLTVSHVISGASEILTVDGTDVALTNGNSVTTAAIGYNAAVALAGEIATVTITKSGDYTASQAQSLVDGLQYKNVSDDPTNNNPDSIFRGITLTSIQDDGGTTGGGTDTTSLIPYSVVTIKAINDAPTLTATGVNPAFINGGAAVGLFTGAAVSAIESVQYISELTFTVSGLSDGINEKISFDGSEISLTNGTYGTTADSSIAYTVSLSGSTATVKAGVMTAAAAKNAVESLKYKNSLAVPTFGERTVTLTSVKDNGGTAGGGIDTTSLVIESTVNVTYVNDPPFLFILNTISNYTENAAKLTLFHSTNITPGPNNPSYEKIRKISLEVQDLKDGAAEQLVINNTPVSLTTHTEVITGGYAAEVTYCATGAAIRITRTGNMTLSEAAILIDSIGYRNSSDNPTDGTRQVILASIQDNGGTANGGIDTNKCSIGRLVVVTAVNDAPVLTLPGAQTFHDVNTHGISIQIADPDIAGGTATVTVTADKNGRLHVDGTIAGLTATGNDSDALSLSGTLSVLNTALAGFTYKPAGSSNISETLTVEVSDGGASGSGGIKTASGNIIVTVNISTTPTKTVSKIVVTPPSKLNYKLGDALDMTGLIVTAWYTDGSTSDVTAYSVISGLDSTTAGEKTIQVFYGTVSATFTVYVSDSVLKGIEAVSPVKTVYTLGEAFDLDGMTVTALFEDGTSEDITSKATLSGFDSQTAGLKTITVTYQGMTDSFYVTVKDTSLLNIEVTPPTKLTYQQGEAFDPAGMKITAVYSDGSSEDVTEAASVSGFDSSSAGIKTITIGYSGKTASFTVTVEGIKELSSISISRLPDKIAYKIGEDFDPEGLVITAVYTNGGSENVTDSASLSGFDSTVSRVSTITASYMEKTAVFDLFILNKTSDFKSVTLEKLPEKLEYYAGEKFTAAGMQVNAVYLVNGAEEQADVTDLVSISGFSNEKAGKKTVKVKYMGKSDTFKVEVLKLEVDELTLNTESLTLTAGDTFNLTVTASFADGTSKDVTSDCKYKLSKKKILTIDSTGNISALKKGKVKITVTYGGSKKSFYVNVAE